jgi:hypothetical protein
MKKMTPPRPLLMVLIALLFAGLGCATVGNLIEEAQSGELLPQVIESTPTSDFSTPPPTLENNGTSIPQFSDEGLSPEIREQMDQIESEVIALRGLQPTGLVSRGLLTEEQLKQRVLDDFLADYTLDEAADDSRILTLLGLVPPGFDLHNLYIELYGEQVAGYYDDELKQMFVVQGSGFQGPERLTYSHEYVHALQDQNYDFEDGLLYNDDSCEQDSERCAGLQALIEGDASLLEEQWLRTYATEQDFDDIFSFYESFQSPVFDATPRALREDLLFPYLYGLDFVMHLYQEGGWAAVDRAYENVPLSTEQILHPELYPEDKPVRYQVPELATTLGAEWREVDSNVLGEWYTRLMLEEQLDPEIAQKSAAGWGGDVYLVLQDDARDNNVLVLASGWDTVRDAHEFYETFREYGNRRFGEHISFSTTEGIWETDGFFSKILVRDDQTLWILAPDATTAEAVLSAIPFPLPQQ